MDWSNYLYLVGVALAAVVLALVGARLVPTLAQQRNARKRPGSEILLLVGIIVLGSLAIYWNCLFGSSRFGYWDVGSDTLEQYVPFYLDYIRGIQAGTWGLWDFHYGLGNAFVAYGSWMNDPFNLLTIPLALLLGTQRLGRILALEQVLKLLVAGLLFDHLLTSYCRAPLSRVLGGSLFAFGGWMVLWGQHYWLGAVYVLSALLALVVELLMERRSAPRFLGVMLVTAASVLMGVYSGYMVLLFGVAYTLIRAGHVSRQAGTGYLRMVGRVALPVVCGLLASCVLLVPYALLILGDSSRVTGAGGMSFSQRFVRYLTGFVPLQWIPLILSRILGNSLVETGGIFPPFVVPYEDSYTYLMNSYEFVTVGVGGGSLILCSQALGHVFRYDTERDRVLAAITTLLAVLFCVNFFLPALSSAFDLKFRGSFAVIFPLVIGSAYGWEKVVSERNVCWPELVVAAVVTFATILWSASVAMDGRLLSAVFLVGTALLLVLLVLSARRPDGRAANVLVALACLAAIGMPVADGFFATNARLMSDVSNFPAATDADANTRAALDYINSTDGDFYRVVKTYSDWTRLNDALVQGYNGVSAYNSTTSAGIIDFYRNVWPDVISTGTAYQDAELGANQLPIHNMLGVRYVLSKTPLDDLGWLELQKQFGDVYVYYNRSANIATDSFVYATESEAAAGTAEERRQLLSGCVIVPDDVAAGLDLAAPSFAEPQSDAANEFRQTSGSSVEGTVNALADSVVCLAIPNTPGWNVTVDGQPVSTFRADYGFIGFTVKAGTHQVAARYRPAGLRVGAILSAVGIVLGVAGCIVFHRKGQGDAGTPKTGRHFSR
jgi:uncharacterized membrane protein YfhO